MAQQIVKCSTTQSGIRGASEKCTILVPVTLLLLSILVPLVFWQFLKLPYISMLHKDATQLRVLLFVCKSIITTFA